MTSYTVAAGPLAVQVARAMDDLDRHAFGEALWGRRLDVWTTDPAIQQKIGNRLGWLEALDFIEPALPRLRTLAESIRAERAGGIVLLGMGGSSLAPEVLRQVVGSQPGSPAFRMLDSVDPDAVRQAMDRAAESLFVIASKSGSTIEPNVMAAEAQRRLQEAGVSGWARRFLAITDADTVLHRRAVDEGFLDVFVNPADIGGRYSALSFFGMVPAALMGIDLAALLAPAREMASACREPAASNNPGLALGAFIAAGALAGRDKLTLLVPERLGAFGLWVEQLIAESTGKQGKGIVPITGESPVGGSGSDRTFVVVKVGGEGPEPAQLETLATAGGPVLTIDIPDVLAIGGEFFRWEVATAAAGFLLGINPFDEPNVQQAKDATNRLLEIYRQQGRLPLPSPHASTDGMRLTLSRAAEDALAGAPAVSFARLLQPSDYFCLLAYLPPDDPAYDPVLRELRAAIGRRAGCATMFGYGPRYLHSTGQLHKGGANTGVFVVITADPEEDLPVPGQPFTFGVLEMAQAVGDFESLDRSGRRALHVHLPRRNPEALRRLATSLTGL